MKTEKDVKTKLISMVTYDNAQVLDVTGPLEVFSMANRFVSEDQAYKTEILAEKKGPVRMSSGITLLADRSFSDVSETIDTLMISGGYGAYDERRNKKLLKFLTGMNTKARRIASVCTGSFILAEAGLLHGKKATTHWADCDLLASEYPEITVEPDKIFIRDGHIYSSAGVTAGIDLALALVEEDCGRKVALKVAKILVVFMKRQGGQSQFSTHLSAQTDSKGSLKGLPEWILENPCKELSVEKLAEKVAMSERNFSRIFVKETGTTPAKFVESIRIDYAASYLENEAMTIDQVAVKSGFGTAEKMRRSFIRHLHVLPGTYRKRFGIN